MFWHCNDQPDTWIYMWASVAAWLLSIFARLFWYNRATNIMSAEWMMLSPISMTSFSDNMTRLRISAPATFHWKPGQHVYLRVPKLNIFDNHPFTIANDHRAGRIGAEYTELDLFIRSHAGFTRRLERYVSNNPDRELNGWLDGPYGSHHSNVGVTFDSVILIAGGGGVSAVLPWLDHLVTRMKNQQSTRTASIKVLWSIRHSGSLHWIRDILEDVDLKGLGDRVKIIVHITGEEQSEPAAAKAMEVEPKSQATDQSRSRGLTCASLDLEYGRIRWTDIFDDILPKSRTIVISKYSNSTDISIFSFVLTFSAGCGPESLKVDISNACAKAQRLVMKGQLAEVELWTETFGW
jgi:predicted ferric reductase